MPTTVNLRALDEELIRRAKVRAAEKGMTLKAWIIELIEERLGPTAEEFVKMTPSEAMRKMRETPKVK